MLINRGSLAKIGTTRGGRSELGGGAFRRRLQWQSELQIAPIAASVRALASKLLHGELPAEPQYNKTSKLMLNRSCHGP